VWQFTSGLSELQSDAKAMVRHIGVFTPLGETLLTLILSRFRRHSSAAVLENMIRLSVDHVPDGLATVGNVNGAFAQVRYGQRRIDPQELIDRRCHVAG
jgi:hypothetical protein